MKIKDLPVTVFNLALLSAVFFTPLIPAGFDLGFEQIKVIFFIFLVSLAAFSWLFLPKRKIHLTKFKLLGGIFIFSLTLTSLTGINSLNSFLGTSPYYQGVIVYVYLFLFSILISQSNISFKAWAIVLSAAASIVSFVGVKDFLLSNLFDRPVLTYAGRVVSTFGQPNFFAGFILINLPFIFYTAFKNFPKLQLWQLVLFLINVAGIAVSLSRGAYFIACLIPLIFLFKYINKSLKKIVIAVFIVAFIIGGAFSIIFSTGVLWFELGGLRINQHALDADANRRIYVWQAALSIIAQRPILGFGLENIQQSYSNYFNKNFGPIYEQSRRVLIGQDLTPGPVLQNIKNLTISRTHNYFLDVFFYAGIFGLLSYLSLIIILFKNSKSKILSTSLLIYIIWIQFQNLSIVNLIQFFLLAGLIDKEEKTKH